MSRFSILLVLMPILYACEEESDSNVLLVIFPNSEVFYEYPYVRSGDGVVMHYRYVFNDDPEIADDEFAEDLYLDLGEISDEFEYNLKSLNLYDIPFVYRRSCFCPAITSQFIKSLDIQGVALNMSGWNIEGNIVITNEVGDENGHILDSWDTALDLTGVYRPQ